MGIFITNKLEFESITIEIGEEAILELSIAKARGLRNVLLEVLPTWGPPKKTISVDCPGQPPYGLWPYKNWELFRENGTDEDDPKTLFCKID